MTLPPNSRVQIPNINIDGSPTNDVSAPKPLSGRDGTDRCRDALIPEPHRDCISACQ